MRGRRRLPRLLLAAILGTGAVACSRSAPARVDGGGAEAPGLLQGPGWELLEEHPHNRGAYTQGLLWWKGRLYESTGKYGASSLRRVDPTTGRVLLNRPLPPDLFGEGLALLGDRFYQLTWQAGRALVWDRDRLEPAGERRYSGEGWGLTAVGDRLVRSDGTATLQILDPDDFRVLRRVRVLEEGRPLEKINELEWIEGYLYANVYQTNRIVAIDLETGRVVRSWDLSRLLGDWYVDDGASVLNGIAWEPGKRRVWVTGKFWPKMFVLRLRDMPRRAREHGAAEGGG